MSIRLWSFVLATLVALTACARSGGDAAKAVTFPVRTATLANGLTIHTLEDRSTPIVAVQVWYKVGSVDEPAGRFGFAHLFEHLMFRGTDRLGPADFMDLLRKAGGGCNAYTTFDRTVYHETVPVSQLPLAFWLEAERMAFLTIDRDGFTTERKVVEEELRVGRDAPYGDAEEKLLPILTGAHPYAHSPIGSIRDLRSATLADVKAWWERSYVPDNAVLIVVGDIGHDEVVRQAQAAFGWIPAGGARRAEAPLLKPFAAAARIDLKLDNAPAPGIGLVWRTLPTGHPDELALGLAASILGEGESSRLHRALVAEGSAVAAMSFQYTLSRGGFTAAAALLAPVGGDLDKVEKRLAAEVAAFLRDGPSADEVAKVRTQALVNLVRGMQEVDDKAAQIGEAVTCGGGLDELNGRLQRLRAITAEDILRAARTWLPLDHALTVRIPGKSVMSSLAGLFTGGKAGDSAAETVAVDPGPAPARGRAGVVRPASVPERAPFAPPAGDFRLPAWQERRLGNGLRVVVVENHETPLVQATLVLPYGSWAEEKPGAASLAMAVLAKGGAGRDEKAQALALESRGISLNGSADHDSASLGASFLAGAADEALRLLGESALAPSFPANAVTLLKTQTATGLAMEAVDPSSIADRLLQRTFWGDHPYGRRVSGEADECQAISGDDLRRTWARIGRVQDACLVIVGDLPAQRAFALAEAHLGHWGPATGAIPAPPAAAPAPAATRILLKDAPGALQAQIRVAAGGITVSDPDAAIAILASGYFGGSFGSRLNKAIRIDKGSTYGAWGSWHRQRFAGDFSAGSFSRTEVAVDTVQTILAEVKRLRAQPPSTDELELQRSFQLGVAPARCETPAQVAGILAGAAAHGLPLDQLVRNLARIRTATAEDCMRLIGRTVDPDRLLIVVVGDAAKLEAGLKALAPVEVIR